MKIKTKNHYISKEKVKLDDGRVLIKDYVVYDSYQNSYLDLTKFWGSHYIGYLYDLECNLISRTVKENEHGQIQDGIRFKLFKNIF